MLLAVVVEVGGRQDLPVVARTGELVRGPVLLCAGAGGGVLVLGALKVQP